MLAHLLKLTGNPWIFGSVVFFELVVFFAFVVYVGRLNGIQKRLRSDERSLEAGIAPEQAASRLDPLVRGELERWLPGFVPHDGTFYRPEDCDRFFTGARVLDDVRTGPITGGVADHLGATATGLGILGTFLGIALGLSQLADSDPTALTENISGVIRSLSSAFSTSIVGVFVAVIGNLRLSFARDRFTAEVDALDARLRALFPTLSPARFLLELRDSAEEQRDALSDVREATNSMADQITEKLTKGLDESLDRILGPAMEKLVELTSGVDRAAGDEIKRFGDKLLDGIQDAIDRMGSSLNAGSEGLAKVVADVGTLSRSFEANLVQQQELVLLQSKAVEDAQKASGETANHVQQVAGAFDQASAVAARFQELETRLTDAATRQAHHQEAMREAVGQVLQRIGESQAKMGAQASALVGRIGEVQVEFQGRLDDLARLGPELRAAVSDSARTLQGAGAALGGVLVELREAVDRVLADANAVAERFQSAAQQLEARIEAEAKLLNTYGRAQHDLESALQRAAPIMEGMRSTAELLADREKQARAAAEILQRAGTDLAARTQQLEQGLARAAAQLDSGAKQVATAAESTSRQVVEAAKAMERSTQAQDAWQAQATQSVQHFARDLSKAIEESMGAFDKELTTAVQTLATPIKDLGEFVDDLVTLTEKVRGVG